LFPVSRFRHRVRRRRQAIFRFPTAIRRPRHIVPNTYANDPQKLAEWVIASHVEKHTPVPRPATLAKKAAAKAAKAKPATP
jgi:hypothetical protein